MKKKNYKKDDAHKQKMVKKRGRFNQFVYLGAFLFFFFVLIIVNGQQVSAAVTGQTIQGYINNSNGDIVQGAVIEVHSTVNRIASLNIDSDDQWGCNCTANQNVTTDANGFYSLNLNNLLADETCSTTLGSVTATNTCHASINTADANRDFVWLEVYGSNATTVHGNNFTRETIPLNNHTWSVIPFGGSLYTYPIIYLLEVTDLPPTFPTVTPNSGYSFTPGNTSFDINLSNGSGFLTDVYLRSNHTGTTNDYNLTSGNVTYVGGGIYRFIMKSLVALTNFQFYWYANNSVGIDNRTLNYSISIAKATPTLNLTLNGQFNNLTISNGTIVNVSGQLLTGESDGRLLLYVNGSLINNGTNSISNQTLFAFPGPYNITLSYNGTQNYSITSHQLNVTATLVNTVPPNVTGVIPIQGSFYNTSQVIQIAANITGITEVDTVLVNITLPNGSIEQLTLQNVTNATGGFLAKFNTSYTLPGIVGLFNLTFIVNDTLNNLNQSVTTNFTSLDATPPSFISFNGDTPNDGSNLSQDSIAISLNASDDLQISGILIELFNESHQLIASNLNTTNTTFAFFNFTSLADGNYYFNATVNDTSNNKNSTVTRNITLDKINPLINFSAPTLANGSSTVQINNFTLNVTVSDSLSGIQSVNLTVRNSTSWINNTLLTGPEYFTTIFSSTSETFYYNITVTDQAGNTNTTATHSITLSFDTAPPNVTSLTESPSDPQSFNSTRVYEFNATVTDDLSVGGVLLEFGGVNYTVYNDSFSVYNMSFVGLAAGNYTYNWNVNDSIGNSNNSENGTYTISQIASVTNLTLNHANQNVTISVGDSVEINGTQIIGDNETTLQILQNGQVINQGTSPVYNLTAFNTAGFYNITLYYAATQNYTAHYSTYFVNATAETFAPNVTSVNVYPANINITQSTNISATIIDFSNISYAAARITIPNGTIIDLLMSNQSNHYNTTFTAGVSYPTGQYNVTIIANDSNGNQNNSEIITFNVSSIAIPITINSPTIITNTPLIGFTLNISSWASGTILYNLDYKGNVTFCTSCTNGQNSIGFGSFNSTFIDEGFHNLVIYANDSSGNSNSTVFNFTLQRDTDGDGTPDNASNVGADDDSDGILNGDDRFNGNQSNFNSDLGNIEIIINGSTDYSIINSTVGILSVNISNGTNTYISFDHNFSLSSIDVYSLVFGETLFSTGVSSGTEGGFFILGLNLSTGMTKSFFIENIDSSSASVCIRDVEDATIDKITGDCSDGSNEVLVACTGSDVSGLNGQTYTCTDLGNVYEITGLTNTAVKENADVTTTVTTSSGGGSGGGFRSELGSTSDYGLVISTMESNVEIGSPVRVNVALKNEIFDIVAGNISFTYAIINQERNIVFIETNILQNDRITENLNFVKILSLPELPEGIYTIELTGVINNVVKKATTTFNILENIAPQFGPAEIFEENILNPLRNSRLFRALRGVFWITILITLFLIGVIVLWIGRIYKTYNLKQQGYGTVESGSNNVLVKKGMIQHMIGFYRRNDGTGM